VTGGGGGLPQVWSDSLRGGSRSCCSRSRYLHERHQLQELVCCMVVQRARGWLRGWQASLMGGARYKHAVASNAAMRWGATWKDRKQCTLALWKKGGKEAVNVGGAGFDKASNSSRDYCEEIVGNGLHRNGFPRYPPALSEVSDSSITKICAALLVALPPTSITAKGLHSNPFGWKQVHVGDGGRERS